MFWSKPVITMTMKIPLTNCFQKYCGLIQSSKKKTRLWGSSPTKRTIPERLSPSCPETT